MKPHARPTRARRALSALILLPLLVVLAGCFRLDMGITVNENETIDVSMEIGDLTGMASRSDMDCSLMESELMGVDTEGTDMTVEDIEVDGNVGCRISADGAPLDTLADDADMSIVRVDDTYEFTFTGDDGGMGLDEFEDMGGMEPQVSMSVTFPGDVIEADGEIDGNTVTWSGIAAFSAGGTASGYATGSGGGGDNTVTWIVLGVVILLALAVLIFLLVKRSKAKSGPAPDAAAPYGQAAQPHQAPADPGAGYPGQQPPAAPAPYTTAATDSPVARPEGESFAPQDPATPQQPGADQVPQAEQSAPAEQQDPPAAPEDDQPR